MALNIRDKFGAASETTELRFNTRYHYHINSATENSGM